VYLWRYAPLTLNFTESFSATFSFRLSFNKCSCSCFRYFVSALACYRNFNRQRTSHNKCSKQCNDSILLYILFQITETMQGREGDTFLEFHSHCDSQWFSV